MVAISGTIREGDLVAFERSGAERLGRILEVVDDTHINDVEENILCSKASPGARVDLVLDMGGTLVETGKWVGVRLEDCERIMRFPAVEDEIQVRYPFQARG